MAAIAIVEVDIRGKLLDIVAMLNEKKEKNEEKKSPEDKLKEIKKIIKS